MNAEKASTLRILKEGIGRHVSVLEAKGGDACHEVRAFLPGYSEESVIPVLFLLTSLAFLEATPGQRNDALDEDEEETEFNEVDGWTPADFLSHLKFEDGRLQICLGRVRGRSVFTELSVFPEGELLIRTFGRGQSAIRWLAYVQGRTHLQKI